MSEFMKFKAKRAICLGHFHYGSELVIINYNYLRDVFFFFPVKKFANSGNYTLF